MKRVHQLGFVLWLVMISGGLLLTWMTQDDVAESYDGKNGPTVKQVIDCQPPECLRVVIPEQFLGGTDGECVAAGMWLLKHFEDPEIKQLLITNRGWVPSAFIRARRGIKSTAKKPRLAAAAC